MHRLLVYCTVPAVGVGTMEILCNPPVTAPRLRTAARPGNWCGAVSWCLPSVAANSGSSSARKSQCTIEEVNSRLTRLEQQSQPLESYPHENPIAIPKPTTPAHAYPPSIWAAHGYNLQGLGDEFGLLTHEQANHLHKNATASIQPPPVPTTGSPPTAAHSAPSKLLEDHHTQNEQGHIIYDHTGKPFDRRW